MPTSFDQDSELENAIAGVYGGSLEDFVSRRDSLAKELRAAGKRESASIVKNLRKPSRVAWALDLTAQTSREAIASLDAALAETLDAHAGRGDVRTAMATLRVAVREFAGQAAHFAERAGLHMESAVLANALLAVLGSQESLQQLRRGMLADIPEAGGLDFLATLPPPAQVARSKPAQTQPPKKASTSSPAYAEADAAARESAQNARSALKESRERSKLAQQALRDAEKSLRAAEVRLRQAEADAMGLRGQVERARQEAEAAAAQLIEAEKLAADTEQRFKGAPKLVN